MKYFSDQDLGPAIISSGKTLNPAGNVIGKRFFLEAGLKFSQYILAEEAEEPLVARRERLVEQLCLLVGGLRCPVGRQERCDEEGHAGGKIHQDLGGSREAVECCNLFIDTVIT